MKINKPYEGCFITIEGGEGSGKSTLAEELTVELGKKGLTVVKTREPGGSKLSEHIRDLLLNQKEIAIGERAELLLFLAARAQHVKEMILPALRQGKFVICERFNDSTIAYQGAARHLGMHYVEELCRLICEDLIVPDCTLLLDLDPEISFQRLKEQRRIPLDRLEQEELQFHREVRQGFLHLADQYPDRIVVVDAALPLDRVLAAVMTALEPFFILKHTR